MNTQEGDSCVEMYKLQGSLGEVPTSVAGKVDRFELQHPCLTIALTETGGILVAVAADSVEHESATLKPTNISVRHPANVGNKDTEGDVFGVGILLGTVAYVGLRAALRTRFGWNGLGGRREFSEGPVPAVERFKSLSSESIRSRKKRSA